MVRASSYSAAAIIVLSLLFTSQHQVECLERAQQEARPIDPTGYFATNSLHQNYSQQLTFDQYVAYAMRSLVLVAGFDTDLHRYDNQQELVDSFERNDSRTAISSEHLRHLSGASYEPAEFELLHDQSDQTLVENELNQAECGRQLDFIYGEAAQLFQNYHSFVKSRRLDLIDFLDSFGAAPSERVMMGNTRWLGSSEQCARAQIARPADPSERPILGRYCVASLQLPTWAPAIAGGRDAPARPTPNASIAELVRTADTIKMGVCLPRACNSLSLWRHSNRLEALVKLARLQQVPYSSARLVQLYCLPDENSPLRQLSSSARLLVALGACWLALVLYASVTHQYQRARRTLLQVAGQSGAAHCEPQMAERNQSKLVQIFAFQHAWQQLFATQAQGRPPVSSESPSRKRPTRRSETSRHSMRQSNLREFFAGRLEPDAEFRSTVMKIYSNSADVSVSPSASISTTAAADEDNDHQPIKALPRARRQSAPLQMESSAANERQQLSAIDGIKVISMIWLIAGHTMLFFMRTIANGRDFWALILDFRFLTIMAGIFPVDSFFTITGVLSSYLKFSKAPRDKARQSLLKPAYWLEIFVRRYLRFMPMYLLIFWYTRDASEFIGQGPMWDYATANTSMRAVCKRESLLVPILFQANFKPIDQHCVKPAWYLANDYQYLLATPLFMFALLVSRRFGYFVLSAGVAASFVMQFLTVYMASEQQHEGKATAATAAPFTDFAGLVNFRPMFASYVLKDLWRLYVLPHNRIAPYLIGLLTGHLMYRFNRRRSKEAAEAAAAAAQAACPSPAPSDDSMDSANMSSSSGVSSQDHESCESPRGRHRQQTIGRMHELDQNQHQECASSTRPANELTLFVGVLKLGLKNLNLWAPLAALVSVVYLPLASLLLEPLTGERARIGASLIIATMRLVWSLAIARLIYVCFTATSSIEAGENWRRNASFVVEMLSSSIWKPWSKIGLSVLLIQWEVIAYVAQIQTSAPVMSISFMLAMVFICIIVSYALGLLIYLLFEFPLAQIELLCIRPKLFA